MMRHHPPIPMPAPAKAGAEEEGERAHKAPSSLEEGVGGGETLQETLKNRARMMRNNPTEPEKRLWMALRDSRLAGFKFRRQDVIGQRIVDMFCPARGLVIEVDGDTHDAAADAARDARMMREFGFVTVRFSNAEIMENLDGCLLRLSAALNETPERWAGRKGHHPPTPSSEEEGGKVEVAPSSLEEGVGGGGTT
jgi:very-short-patch-repair endonuclease